jgi:hypothetical protein
MHSTSSSAVAIVCERDGVGLLKLRICVSDLPIVFLDYLFLSCEGDITVAVS